MKLEYDLSYIKTITGDDEIIFKEMIQTFVDETKSICETIDKAKEEKNYNTIKINAHKLKASLKMFGAVHAADICMKIEKEVMDTDDINSLLILYADVKGFCEELNNELTQKFLD